MARSRRGPVAWVRSAVRTLALGVVGYLVACALLLVAYRSVAPPITTVQIQRLAEAAVAGEPFDLQYRPVAEAAQDEDIRRAVVASEDARFYTHDGFDWEELRIAREDAERTGRPMRGASTLTQQLVKNLFLTTHRSVVRKGFEVPLTLLAEWILPKDRILTLYLDVAEWGPGVFGIEAAAGHHYGTTASALSRDQAARLAAVLPAPRDRRPQDMARTSARIQTRMQQMGW
ncbi:MAG: monofunctional biosynthetic peptidoglycan transglycosylase [Bacteroidota bacterium]